MPTIAKPVSTVPSSVPSVWLSGMLAAAITGAAGGVLSALASMGIDGEHFNLEGGFNHLVKMALSAAAINAIIGVCAYLKQSPIPR